MSLSVTTIADVAQAVVEGLNGAPDGTFEGLASTETLNATRVWEIDWDIEAGDLEGLSIHVSPDPVSRQLLNRRGDSLREFKVDIVIRKRLPEGVLPTESGDTARIDALVKLVQQIVEYPRTAPQDFDGSTFKYVRTEQDATFDRGMMRSKASLFAALVSYVFKVGN